MNAKTIAQRITVCLAAATLLLTPAHVRAKEASASLNLARQLNQAFIEVADNVSPAVVVIKVVGKPDDGQSLLERDIPFFDMLPPELKERFKSTPKRRGSHPAPQGQGSGVVIRDDGYILTNGHVVDGAEKITVRFKDGKEYSGKVQGIDKQSDIAVIKIDAKGLKTAKLADSAKTRVGEFAIAIGAPFDLDYSVTFGHVSAKGRSSILPSSMMMDQDFIQTDARINPGNSGGPLVNLDSEVIGINTLIRGMDTGIGFAVPSNLAKEVADKLISDGKFTRAWLGISIQTLAEDKDYRDLVKGIANGVVVRAILPDGPAAKSQLEPGDVIFTVDGKAVATVQELKGEIRLKKINAPVSLDVYRDGKRIKVKVSPAELPEDQFAMNKGTKKSADADSKSLGLTVKTITPEVAKEYGVDEVSGVIVTEVENDSPAAQRNIKPGDIITKVNSRSVTNAKDFKDAMKDVNSKKGVKLNVIGESGRRLEILKDNGD